MKYQKLILVTAVFLNIEVKSQIKIFSGGNLNIGDVNPPATSSKVQVVGNAVFLSSNSSVTSAPYIRGYNGYSTAQYPDFTWYGDVSTGFFHPAYNLIGITVNNSEKFRFNGNGQLLNTNSASSASTPDFSWNNSPGTGIFRAAANVIGFSASGSEKNRINSNGHFMMNTTSIDNAWLNIKNTDNMGAYIEIYHNNDWWTTFRTETNRNLSMNYVLTLAGATNFYVAGAGWIYSQGNYLGSDKNIKDDIKTIDSASSKINKIRGVTYKLKKEKQNSSLYGVANDYMGVIAQEVEQVAPEVVKTFKDGTKGVCYEMLVGLLIQGMKEQNNKIAQLQNDLNTCCTAKTSNRLNTNSPNNPQEGINDIILSSGGSYIKQNTPNPFNKETSIDYYIAEKGTNSNILIFDMNGKLLKTLRLSGIGNGTVTISGSDLQPGMYYYSLVVGNKEIDTKKMILTE
jgi:hypothetical protein